MNYFRSRFQRDSVTSYGLDSEKYLRDYRRRKNEADRQSTVKSYPSPSIDKKEYESPTFLELPSPYRRETSVWIEPRSEARSQSPPETKKSSGLSFFRSLRSLSRMSSNNSTKDLDEIENTPPPAPNIGTAYPTRNSEDTKPGKANHLEIENGSNFSGRYLDTPSSRFSSRESTSLVLPSRMQSNELAMMAPTYRFTSNETSVQARSNNHSSNELPLPLLSNGFSSNELAVPSVSNRFSSNECQTMSPSNGYCLNEPSMLATSLGGSPYKRRRETEIENQKFLEDDNPFTKRNFERQNIAHNSPETTEAKPERRRRRPEPKEEEEEIDPLSLIEIKSAVQWKAMSKRISFSFDQDEDVKKSGSTAQAEPCQETETKSTPVVIVKDAPSKERRHRPRRNRPINYSIKPVPFEAKEGFKPTTVPQLRLLCWKIKPWKEPKSFKLFSSQYGVQWGVDCDEVYPGLFIGDKASAMNIAFLKKYGITHILNTAEGKEEGLVDLCQEYYGDSGISYLGFPLWDTPTCNILPFVGCAADFIDDAISGGGKCLVNCQMGVSRSASCAMSYLMIKQGMLAVDVMTTVRKSRDCRPNDGFLEQLVELDNDLRQHRELGLPQKLVLSTLDDRDSLPNPWNFEFWTQEVSVEDLGMPLVRLGEPHPMLINSTFSSVRTSTVPSRNLSRKPSSSGDYAKGLSRRSSLGVSNSFRKSRSNSRQCSRHDSLSQKVPNSRPASKSLSVKSENGQENDEDWEWVWEDDEDITNELSVFTEADKEEEDCQPTFETNLNIKNHFMDQCTKEQPSSSLWTTQKLEEVKNIIEKPEERWRVLWHQPRLTESPPSPCGSSKSFSSSKGSWNNRTSIQAGVDNDPLALVKVGSARHWKAISHRLTINFEDLDLEENREEEHQHQQPQQQPDIEEEMKESEDRPTTPLDFKPTTAQQLRLVCWRIKPWDTQKDRNLFTSVMGSGWGVDCDEVHANIFIGDKASAQNIRFLQKMGITHVLNAAEGDWEGSVDLSQEHYAGTGIKYLGLPLWDDVSARILPYLGCANEFIASALNGQSGKCLVNCQMGVSRSCAAAMSYMMISLGWKAVDVLRTFRTRRDVRPNDTFMEHLAELDNDLRKCREHRVSRKLKLASLNEIETLPKPWHFEFWETIPDDLPFNLCHLGELPQDCLNNNSSNLDIVLNGDRSRSSPIEIVCEKHSPHLYMTKLFQTSDERQEVTLPSPARLSIPNSYTATVCLKVLGPSCKSLDSGHDDNANFNVDNASEEDSSEWDWEYYSETEDEDILSESNPQKCEE